MLIKIPGVVANQCQRYKASRKQKALISGSSPKSQESLAVWAMVVMILLSKGHCPYLYSYSCPMATKISDTKHATLFGSIHSLLTILI